MTVTNSGTTAATVSGVTASGDFSQTNTCSHPRRRRVLHGHREVHPDHLGHPHRRGHRHQQRQQQPDRRSRCPAAASAPPPTSRWPAGHREQPGQRRPRRPTTATDGDANTYWESANNAFPQWLQVDLGGAYSIGKVTLKLPPSTAWATRTQTLSVQTSTDGSNFSTAVGSATYTFNPASANTVNVTVPATNARYVRVNITANSGWPAGQVSELEVYPSGGSPTNSASAECHPVLAHLRHARR